MRKMPEQSSPAFLRKHGETVKIVLAPDKFKGNMTSPEVCSIIREAFLSVMPEAEILALPMADGGEGTVDAVIAADGGEIRQVEVTGPLGGKVMARFGLCNHGKSGVLEMSSASGLALVPPEKLNPLRATTYGTGELIRTVLDCGVEELTIGIGGSATVDGGAGMAQALGYHLLKAKNWSPARNFWQILHKSTLPKRISGSFPQKSESHAMSRTPCWVRTAPQRYMVPRKARRRKW